MPTDIGLTKCIRRIAYIALTKASIELHTSQDVFCLETLYSKNYKKKIKH